MKIDSLQKIITYQPYPLLFATLSGSHLYGFSSPDSDYDLRGSHILPVQEVIGLFPPQETIEISQTQDDFALDLVTHDIKKFFGLLLKRNGYVLEQLYSPLVIYTSPFHQELKAIATGCITRYHAHHYLGFAKTQWRLFEKAQPRQIKPLLYVYRVLLTGIYLMQTGEIEANLVRLNEVFNLSFIPELIKLKLEGTEKTILEDVELNFHQQKYEQLYQQLENSATKSQLREEPSVKSELNDLLIRIRLKYG